MAIHNRPKHPRRPILTDRYDLDDVNLPEHPGFTRIIVKPLKTMLVNLDADFNADDFYVVSNLNDPIMRKIAERI